MPVTEALLGASNAHTTAVITSALTPDAGKLTILWAGNSQNLAFNVTTTGTGGFDTTWTRFVSVGSIVRLDAWRGITVSSASGTIKFQLTGAVAADISWIVEQYTGVQTTAANQGILQAGQNNTNSTTATMLIPGLAAFTTSGNATIWGGYQGSGSTGFTLGTSFTDFALWTASTVPSAIATELCPTETHAAFGAFSTGGPLAAGDAKLATAPAVTAQPGRRRALMGIGR